MKRLFIILLSALSLAAFTQEKRSIVIAPVNCPNTMFASLAKNILIRDFVRSDEWQVLERPSKDEMNLMVLEGRKIGDMPTAQYMLSTEIQDKQGMYFISCQIVDVETAAIVRSSTQISESSPNSIQQACSSITNQLLEKQ